MATSRVKPKATAVGKKAPKVRKPAAPKPAATKQATPKQAPPKATATKATAKRAPEKATRKTKPAATKQAKPKPGAAKQATKPKQAATKPKPGTAKRATKPATKKPAAKQATKAAPEVGGGGEVVRILDSPDPIGSLETFLDGIGGGATIPEGQIALGSAQLMLLPMGREARGGPEVKALLDLVLGRWTTFPDRTGFHAQEFLRNAFAAVGNDRERVARLTALVPVDAGPELRFNVACALAVAGERDAMLRAIEAALAVGSSAASFRNDDDFAAYRDDAGFQEVLARAAAPAIPVDIGPHVPIVRASLESVVRTLREYGEVAKLEPPASLDAVLGVERVRKLQLPNDYRALLTICDGLTLWDRTFFGTVDYKNDTDLAKRARKYIQRSARYGRTGIDDCVPLANWGQPNDWLLYDPQGHVRGGAPGYVLMLNADECPLDGLAHALDRFERIARDVLGTN